MIRGLKTSAMSRTIGWTNVGRTRVDCGPAMKLSVVIPVKNGGALLREVIAAVWSQRVSGTLELVVVDSGSTDGSRQWLAEEQRREPRLHVLDIQPGEFNHGRTRNLGIRASSGEGVALLTQDATPVGTQWLDRLAGQVFAAPDIAGATGRQLPYPDAPLCVRRELISHFERVATYPRVFRASEGDWTDEAYRQMGHFFSNNNTLLRRSAWETVPFPEAEFGEDQRWAEAALAQGWAKAYAEDAVVLHSHAYGLRETFARQRVEGAYYRKHFGYVLVPRFRDLPLLSWRLARADLHFQRSHPEWRVPARDLPRSFALNVARLAGLYAGSQDAAPQR